MCKECVGNKFSQFSELSCVVTLCICPRDKVISRVVVIVEI